MAASLLIGLAAQDQPSLAARVNRAIARGVEHLRARQLPDGNWPGPEGEHPGGMTALCSFTLVKSGVRRGDDSIQRGLRSALATEFKSTYSHSVRLLFLEALGQPELWRDRAAVSLDFLVANQANGEWAYPWGEADASNTQFALLGLRAAQRLGLEIPDETLARAVRPLFALQEKGTGFKYRFDSRPTGGMTAATLGGLCVLRELGDGRSSVERELRKHDKERELAERWMESAWDPARNASGDRAWTPSWQFSYLWAVERYGGLAGRTSLGGHDWYSEGAEWLVLEQHADGSWGTALQDVCFALLFLRRATVTSGGALGEDDASIDAPAKAPAIEPSGELAWIVDWLIAGPWRGDAPNTILGDLPFDPRKVQAKAGDKLARREWVRRTLKSDDWTNLDELCASEGDMGLYAAATTLAWGADEPLEATLWFHLEDGWAVYLDGECLSVSERVAAPIDGRIAVAITLQRGEHRLLALVEDDRGSAAFGVRLSARDGKPLASPPQVMAVPRRKR